MGAERERHPSAGAWRPDLARMEQRLTEALRAEGVPFPEVGAGALTARGRVGADRLEWASQHGTDAELVLAAEEGLLAWAPGPEPPVA